MSDTQGSEEMHTHLGSTGIRLDGVCDPCSGMGELALTNRAACWPKHYPKELGVCGNCKGLGGVDEAAGERGRAAGEMYKAALGLDDIEPTEPPDDPRTFEQVLAEEAVEVSRPKAGAT